MELDSFSYDITLTLGKLRAKVISEHIAILLRDKPRWLPRKVWDKLLGTILVIKIKEINNV
ncbi:hypothetical protein LCGC14_2249660 [marine sediment metagenome]|uniref:Uncharacterized protein n=1 Tax=marine sediment metagenome TaxID=412755 RepID=A0A0F9D3A0_9ZZZZ